VIYAQHSDADMVGTTKERNAQLALMGDESTCYPRFSGGLGMVWQSNPLELPKKRRYACWERPTNACAISLAPPVAPSPMTKHFWRLGFKSSVHAKNSKSARGSVILAPVAGSEVRACPRQERGVSSTMEDEAVNMLRSLFSGIEQDLRVASLLYREEEAHPREHCHVDVLDCGARVTTELRVLPKSVNAGSVAFTSFAPKVFLSLRGLRGFSSEDMRVALSAVNHSEGLKEGNGKSGAFFMFTPCRRFLLKTLTEAEKDFLLSILPNYFEHMRSNPDTLLPWFLGMYRMKAKGVSAKGVSSKSDDTVRVIVMANVFDNGVSKGVNLEEQYDLKGSTHARTNNKESGPAKDLDWMTRSRRMVLEPEMYNKLQSQLTADVAFLESQNIMDYSLLVGISRSVVSHTPVKENDKKSASLFFPSLSTLFKPDQDSLVRACECESTSAKNRGLFRQHFGGIKPATTTAGGVYWCGIIDILQPFNLKKKIEMTVKGKMTAGGKDAVSCADPHFYGQRFLSFVQNDVLSSNGAPGAHLLKKSKRHCH